MSSGDLDIRRLRAHYRLPAGNADGKQRLDLAIRRALDEVVEVALAGAGLGDDEICIRSLHAFARLDLSGTHSTLAEEWAQALVAAIRVAVETGRDVIRYRSKAHALVDLLEGAATGDLSRAWAWAQLGLCARSVSSVGLNELPELVVAAARAAPELFVAGVAAISKRGQLRQLVQRIGPSALELAAGTVLGASGHTELRNSLSRVDAVEWPVGADARSARIVSRSRIASAARMQRLTPRERIWLAVLAVLEVEPDGLATATSTVVSTGQRAVTEEPSGSQRAEALVLAIAHAIDSPASGSKPTSRDARTSDPRERGAANEAPVPRYEKRRPGEQGAHEPEPRLELVESVDARDAEPALSDDGERAVPAIRVEGFTRAGGLLFLLHLVGELRLPERRLQGVLAQRSLRSTLHALALALIPIEPRDAAALAFAGLAPDAVPPSEEEPALSDDERRELNGWASEISDALWKRLGEPEEGARATLLATCRREAQILADPAWIEVRLPIDSVATSVRRTGLDLDPGWLPWLGCVVRFVYA